MNPLLRVEGLTANLSTPSGDRPVVKDVSFSLRGGNVYSAWSVSRAVERA